MSFSSWVGGGGCIGPRPLGTHATAGSVGRPPGGWANAQAGEGWGGGVSLAIKGGDGAEMEPGIHYSNGSRVSNPAPAQKKSFQRKTPRNLGGLKKAQKSRFSHTFFFWKSTLTIHQKFIFATEKNSLVPGGPGPPVCTANGPPRGFDPPFSPHTLGGWVDLEVYLGQPK